MKKRNIGCILCLIGLCLVISGCGVKEEKKAENNVKKDAVLSQTEKKKGKIELVDVVGKTQETAKTTLEAKGFEVKIVEEYNDTVPSNIVISQIPIIENGLTLSEGDLVTLKVSLGKEVGKETYLDSMAYIDFYTDTANNGFSSFAGEDTFGNKCQRAIRYDVTANKSNYPEGFSNPEGKMTATYNLDGKHKKFLTTLTNAMGYSTINSSIKIYKDDTILYSMGVTKETQPIDLEFDVTGTNLLKIEATVAINGNYGTGTGSIILDKARFE